MTALMVLSFVRSLIAQCDLQIETAETCLANGIPGTPHAGDTYGIKVVVKITGIRVEFHLPGVECLITDPTDGNSADPTGTYALELISRVNP